jgi:hypothetical protein
VIAALTTGAISAAVVYGAVKATTGGDTAVVATNLAYPIGDMVLLGAIVGSRLFSPDSMSEPVMLARAACPIMDLGESETATGGV